MVTGISATNSFSGVNAAFGAAASGSFSLGSGPWGGIPGAAWSPDGKSLILIAGDGIAAYMDAVMVRF